MPRTARRARSSTSAGTAARSSPRARATGRRCSVRTTRGRTASTGGCARRRGRTSTLDGVGLEPVRLERWGPFLFVNADADAEPLARLARAGSGAGRRARPRRRLAASSITASEWSVAANWKVVAENFLECYHCAVAHPGFSALVDVSPDAYRLEVGRLHSTQIGPARDGARRSQFHFVWPNTGINVFPGEANLSIGPFVPGAPERTDRFLDYFFGADVSEAWISELLELDDVVGREDDGARRARPGRRELRRDRRRAPARRRRAARRALPGPRARRAGLAPAEEPAAPALRLRLLAERTRAGGDVVRGERDQLVGADLVDPAGEAQRVLAQRLLEQRAREPRVAEALAALRAVEDPSAASRPRPRRSGTRCRSRTSP